MEASGPVESKEVDVESEETEKPKSETTVPDGGKTPSSSSYSYEGDTYVYTDSATGFQYKWDSAENKWVPKVTEPKVPADNGEPKYELCDGTYMYKDEKTGRVLVWDLEAKEWKPKGEKQAVKKKKRGSDEEFNTSDESEDEKTLEQQKKNISYNIQVLSDGTQTYTDPSDGTVYEWDDEKKAWFPKLDDEFLARYQLSYGVDSEAPPVVEEPALKPEDEPKAKKKPSEPTWFEIDDSRNPKVYVSGLPSDITEKEFIEFMQKCGLVEKDVQTGKMKVKLYKTEDGQMKGDALCTYIKVESVELALKILDGSQIRGQTIRVERAKFTLKGEYDPTKKPRKRKKKELEKMKKKQEMLFDWRPDQLRGERGKHESVVVLKRLFKPEEFDTDPSLLLEYQRDLREECAKFGSIKKVVIFDRHDEGVAQLFFRAPEEADLCIEKLHGRWFAGKKISAETWDGVTKYKKEETEAEHQERLAKWEQYLKEDEDKSGTASGEN